MCHGYVNFVKDCGSSASTEKCGKTDKCIVLIIQKCIKVRLIHIRTLSDCHENDSLDIHLAILSH